jgi:hypothetical protein
MLPSNSINASTFTGDSLYFLVILLTIYFAPTIIAYWRGHHSRMAIAAVNLLFGWTVIGFFWAFIWSLTGVGPKRPFHYLD